MFEITVIIIAKREPKIYYTLDSLRKQTKKPYEVIVVVDSPEDPVVNITKKHPINQNVNVEIIINHLHGVGGARKTGVEKTRGEIVAFIDADCIADENWIKNLDEGFSEKDIAVQSGKVIDIKSPSETPMNVEKNEKITYLKFAPSLNFAFKKDIVDVIGNFDQEFKRGGEDLDFCIRLAKAGYKIYYNPKVKVYHLVKEYDLQRAWRDGRSRAKAFIKHKTAILKDICSILLHVSLLLIFLTMMVTHHLKLAILAISPSLIHRLYRTWIGVKQGQPFTVSLVRSLISYISYISFTAFLPILTIKKLLKNKQTNKIHPRADLFNSS